MVKGVRERHLEWMAGCMRLRRQQRRPQGRQYRRPSPLHQQHGNKTSHETAQARILPHLRASTRSRSVSTSSPPRPPPPPNLSPTNPFLLPHTPPARSLARTQSTSSPTSPCNANDTKPAAKSTAASPASSPSNSTSFAEQLEASPLASVPPYPSLTNSESSASPSTWVSRV